MKIDAKTLEPGFYRIKIQIEPVDYADRLNEELKKLRKKIQFPGFRPGKVPVSLIQKQFGKTIKSEVIDKIIDEHFKEFIESNDLFIFDDIIQESPDDLDEEMKKENPEFVYEIGYVPKSEIKIPLDKLKQVPRYRIELTDENIDDYVDIKRRFYGSMVPVEKFEPGTFMDITIQPENGKEEQKISTSISYTLASENKKVLNILKKLQKDKTHELSFEEAEDLLKLVIDNEDIEENLKLEPTDKLILTLEEINKIKPIEITPEFLAQAYPDEGLKTEEDFRNYMKEELQTFFEHEAQSFYLKNIEEILINENKWPVPESYFKKLYSLQDITDEQISEVLNEGFLRAKKREQIFKYYFFENNLELSSEDFTQAVVNRTLAWLRYAGEYEKMEDYNQVIEIGLALIKENEHFKNEVMNFAFVAKGLAHLLSVLQPEEKLISSREFTQIQEQFLENTNSTYEEKSAS